MALKRTMTVTWDGLHELEGDDDDDDEFFESSNRLSTIVPLNLATSVPIRNSLRRSFRNDLLDLSDDDDDEDFIDTRMSFTAAAPIPIRNSFRRSFRNSIIRHSFRAPLNDPNPPPEVVFPGEQMETYGIWMAAPDSIMERRKRLLQGMGLNSRKDLNRLTTARFVSKKFKENQFSRPPIPLPNAAPAAPSSAPPPSNYAASSSPAAPVVVPVPVPVSPTPAPVSARTSSSPTTNNTAPDTSQAVDENQNPTQTPEVQAVITSASSSPSHSLSTSPTGQESSTDELSGSSSSVTPTSHSVPVILFRSRSDSDISPYSIHIKRRKEEMIGKGVSKQKLTRTSSTLAPCARLCRLNINSIKIVRGSREALELGLDSASDHTGDHSSSGGGHHAGSPGNINAFFLIKNLDTGKEFIVKEFDEEGMWNRLSDLQTGKQMTREEFEKSVGHSPLVKELMRRQSWKAPVRKAVMNNYLTKSFRMSKKKGSSMLKNIKSKAHSMRSGINVLEGKDHHHHHHQKDGEKEKDKEREKEKDKEKEKEEKEKDKEMDKEKDNDNEKEKEKDKDKEKEQKTQAAAGDVTKGPSPEWVKVRQQGKTYKDLTALRLSQEIDAHEGSIWTIKFDPEGKYLASAGEDKVIHVWEVQECEVASLITQEDQSATSSGTATQKKGGKTGSKKGGGVMPEYVQLPETAFALSEKPVCSFTGHLDDVLDLSWSNTQLQLLSSSMDKTVRLWDLETKTCLKLFAHNDYVTCIQFNPVNDKYFISGSLDAKLRIWNVTERRVIDWVDLHEMVTAACYSLDGQTAAVGSHKGTCRMYNTADGKLTQTSNFEIPNKNKKKVTKITGFEFTPENPSEIMITSADSRIRIYEGTDVVQKFRGYKNTSSQIVASYSPSAKHIICASEDSNVYIWRREELRPNPNPGKARVALDVCQFEQFQCKDVSVAVPWPGSNNAAKKKSNNDKPAGSSPDGNNNNKKQQLPPLPKKNKQQKNDSEQEKIQDDSGEKEKSNGESDQNGEKDPETVETEAGASDAANGESSTSGEAANGAGGESPSVSASAPAAPSHRSTPSWPSGWGWQGVGGGGGQSVADPAAWGLVIVTAGQGGEIKIYQNFGLPVRVGNKGSLFS